MANIELTVAEPKTINKSYLTVDVYDVTGKVVGQETLNKDIFAKTASPALLAQAIRVLQANQRQGTAKVKGRAEVKGGGRKPWRQKGTGRARQGSIRSPQWRGGGVVHGKFPKDWSLDLPKKQRTMALLGALTVKAEALEIIILNNLESKNGKTKEVSAILSKMPVNTGKTLLVILPERDMLLLRAMKNIVKVSVDTVKNLNTLDVLTANKLLLTKDAITALENFFLKKEPKVAALVEEKAAAEVKVEAPKKEVSKPVVKKIVKKVAK